MSHAAIEGAAGTGSLKSDEIPVARLFPLSPGSWRTVGVEHGLDRELRVLFAAAHQMVRERDSEIVRLSASSVFGAVQDELAPLLGHAPPPRFAREMASALALCVAGLYWVEANLGLVKDCQLSATGGEAPLAVCGSTGIGCGVVFRGSVRRNAHPFPRWCERCGRSGQTRRWRDREQPAWWDTPEWTVPDAIGRLEMIAAHDQLREELAKRLEGYREEIAASRRISSDLGD